MFHPAPRFPSSLLANMPILESVQFSRFPFQCEFLHHCFLRRKPRTKKPPEQNWWGKTQIFYDRAAPFHLPWSTTIIGKQTATQVLYALRFQGMAR